MKKGIFAFCLIVSLIFLAFSVNAVSSDIKETYSPKETMIIEVLGSILSNIAPEQVSFKRGNVNVPLEYDVKKVGNSHYIWAIAPENENNYTILINDISSMVAGSVKVVNYTKEFTVSGNISDYYIKPGFIIANKDFEIKAVSNLDSSNSIALSYPESRDFVLKPGENTIPFKFQNINGSGEIKIIVGKYSVPAYIIGSLADDESPNIARIKRIKFNPARIDSIIFTESKYPVYKVGLLNDGESEIKGIYLDYDRLLFSVTPDAKIDLGVNESYYYNITLRNRNINYSFNDTIYARYENLSTPLNLNIGFTVNKSSASVSYSNFVPNSDYSSNVCAEIGNSHLCSASESCNGTVVNTAEGSCCIGLCVPDSGNSSGTSWFLWILVIVIVGILGYVGYKYYKGKE